MLISRSIVALEIAFQLLGSRSTAWPDAIEKVLPAESAEALRNACAVGKAIDALGVTADSVEALAIVDSIHDDARKALTQGEAAWAIVREAPDDPSMYEPRRPSDTALRAWLGAALDEHADKLERESRAYGSGRQVIVFPEAGQALLDRVGFLLGRASPVWDASIQRSRALDAVLGRSPNAELLAKSLSNVARILRALRPVIVPDTRNAGPSAPDLASLRATLQRWCVRFRDHEFLEGREGHLRRKSCRSTVGVTPRQFQQAFPELAWDTTPLWTAKEALGLPYVLPPYEPEFADAVHGHRLEIMRGSLPIDPPTRDEEPGERWFVLHLARHTRERPNKDGEYPVDWRVVNGVAAAHGLDLNESLADNVRDVLIATGPHKEVLGARLVGWVPI